MNLEILDVSPRTERSIALVARNGGAEVVGEARGFITGDRSHEATLFFIKSERARVGIATRLLIEFLHWAKQNGATDATADLLRDEEIATRRAWFEERGFLFHYDGHSAYGNIEHLLKVNSR